MAAAAPLAKFSVIDNVRWYVNKMLGVHGMKVFLLDEETCGIVSLVYSQTELVSHNAMLSRTLNLEVGELETGKKSTTGHLKAVVFVRPTDINLKNIKILLENPKYSEYHIFFSNLVPQKYLQELADADVYSVVRQVQEYYADYYAVNDNLWHLNLSKNFRLLDDPAFWMKTTHESFGRNVDGALACMLSFRTKFAIRYANYSKLATVFAQEVTKRIMEEKGLFDYGGEARALLLVIDRKDDPITPLLSQWTYQAMVHELLGIKNNIVDMSSVESLHKDHKEMVLSPSQDEFFGRSIYSLFNDVIGGINKVAAEYGAEKKRVQGMHDIKELMKFTENYAEFNKKQLTTTKHLTVLTKVADVANKRKLFEIGELEQELACKHDHKVALEKVEKFIVDDSIDVRDKLRLALLYAIRYENEEGNQVGKFDLTLGAHSVFVNLMNKMGSKARGPDILGGRGWKTPVATLAAMFKEVNNIFTQHKPYLCDILNFLRTTPKAAAYPFAHGAVTPEAGWPLIVVYIIGGVTYEESLAIHNMESEPAWRNTKIILGGSCIHNSRSFIEDLIDDVVLDIK
ncbi:MAG: putative vacuolar protein sortingassociated protein 45 [Hyperionvirus sp.]|uniref:Putative vacuolar protein sortingassociated protein 45 n=1 Tax=Hyperionvirus sp. TaxID=2487770 RepID=A0A3G5A9I9_9VIRU|nr:MAG: putative vacuolar protein sortingassociated protein 45 [Hyperionvirus sp.]